MVLIPIKVPESPESEAEELVSPANSLKRQLLGAAVLLALAAIFLPLLLDGSGSESRFRRVENVREYPPRIIGADGQPESPVSAKPGAEPIVAAAREVDTPPRPVIPKPAPEPRTKPIVDLKAIAAAKLEELVAKPQEVVAAPVRRSSPSAEIDAALESLGERPADRNNPPQQPTSSVLAETADNPVTEAWVIQAGSFADQDNAVRLRDSLRERGFPSFISTAGDRDVTQTLRYRVQVGPLADRLNVEQRQRQIELITGRSALVREYR